VIRAFYGIGTKPMSLEEIGQTIGISRERTRQIKEKAIKHLRQKSKNKLLKTYLG
jgi:RNA polymerase primary sigma factor